MVINSDLPVYKTLVPIELSSGVLKPKVLECPKEDNLHIISVRYGFRNQTLCPSPSSLIVYSDEKYCNSVKEFFHKIETE